MDYRYYIITSSTIHAVFKKMWERLFFFASETFREFSSVSCSHLDPFEARLKHVVCVLTVPALPLDGAMHPWWIAPSHQHSKQVRGVMALLSRGPFPQTIPEVVIEMKRDSGISILLTPSVMHVGRILQLLYEWWMLCAHCSQLILFCLILPYLPSPKRCRKYAILRINLNSINDFYK